MNCIVVKFSNNDLNAILWIDTNRKVVLKEKQYNNQGKLIKDNIYNVQLDIVNDNESHLPDITNYNYIKE